MLNRMDEGGEAMGTSLSALMDGEVTAAEAGAMCARWRAEEAVRERWSTYHLIGDVLRSEDLVSRPAHDAEFLAGLRARLADEPLPLAPRPETPARHRLSWPIASAAAAAGFVVVAGAMVVMRPAGGDHPATLAERTPDEIKLVSGKVVRDAQLDRYLALHRRVSNGASVGMPGAVVRSVDSIVVEDK
jgi:sigma-E factor negative regulatory protein RseA